jgi:DNA polymerase III epsilon subunit-like protein
MNKYVFYGCDTETTGLTLEHDIIELSIYRLSDDAQKTWFLKPLNTKNIDEGALRVNKHILADLLGETPYGRETYKDPTKVLVEIENWIAEDDVPASNRCLIGHNVGFDKGMMEQLWKKCNAIDTFPFGRRFLDTMQIELMLDFCKNDFAEGYSLNNLSKKYGVKNEKAHSAAADTKCTVDIFRKQSDLISKFFKNKDKNKDNDQDSVLLPV